MDTSKSSGDAGTTAEVSPEERARRVRELFEKFDKLGISTGGRKWTRDEMNER